MILVFKTISPKRRDRLERLLKIEGIPYDIGGTGVNTKNFGFWVEESYADEARALVAKHRRELMLLEGPPWRFIAIAFVGQSRNKPLITSGPQSD
jgi:hypothetical protein